MKCKPHASEIRGLADCKLADSCNSVLQSCYLSLLPISNIEIEAGSYRANGCGTSFRPHRTGRRMTVRTNERTNERKHRINRDMLTDAGVSPRWSSSRQLQPQHNSSFTTTATHLREPFNYVTNMSLLLGDGVHGRRIEIAVAGRCVLKDIRWT